ncbi:MAG: hypothetical protein ACOVNU_07855 [Candidatus Kapaibacteriota bacterium]|jgi:hypothetical protein
MRKSIILAIFVVFAPLLLTDCTPMITEEQKIMLTELRRKEVSLGDEITKINSANMKLEGEIKSSQAVADDCNKRRKFVEDKLKNWPNVWPDYTPNP